MGTVIGSTTIECVTGDITEQTLDAIVNAANRTLLGGGGVDGAIHRAGGPAILEECRGLGGCETGDAKATTAGRLPCKRVVHTVGPIWSDAAANDCDRLLSSAYRRSLEVAASEGLRSIAFPSISTGAYGFPVHRAARVAVARLAAFCRASDAFELIRMVLFTAADRDVYRSALDELG